jgi:hypothetical protein
VFYAELASALYGQKDVPVLTSFIGNLGGGYLKRQGALRPPLQPGTK